MPLNLNLLLQIWAKSLLSAWASKGVEVLESRGGRESKTDLDVYTVVQMQK